MNKKVLIICTSLNMGGTEKQAVWLANRKICKWMNKTFTTSGFDEREGIFSFG